MHGIDYNETFASTIRINILRAILVLIAIKDLKTKQVDINNAFTESLLKHLIYIDVSSDVNMKQREYLRLLQSLYNLKQAAYD